MANPHPTGAPARFSFRGAENLLQRIRDVVERGRIDVAQLRIGNLVGWLLARGKTADSPQALADICTVLETAARLVLLKARRLAGSWEPAPEEIFTPWGGPPAELPLRRSWLAERVAAGPLSYGPPTRPHEDGIQMLAPIAAARVQAVMLALLARTKAPRLRVVSLQRIVRASVEACCSLILDHIGRGHELSLFEVAGEGRDAQVATFLACLLLARQGRVELQQDVLFADIRVRAASQSLEASA
jgi:chromatin segregation and condensation protein Rec8/ScpA/Scc1 (kleisin family)